MDAKLDSFPIDLSQVISNLFLENENYDVVINLSKNYFLDVPFIISLTKTLPI